MDQILENLLDNALKYTPEHGQVAVHLERQDDSLTLSVHDSGPGIAPQERQRVFERFFRSADAVQSAPGSGLGLAIVRAIADRHQATVALGSSASLGGLQASVTFAAA